jgi:hypothetical protein
MDVLKEQRVCIKFCQKLGKTATETFEMVQQAFGETALSRSKTFDRYSRLKMAARPLTMIYTQAGHQRREPTRLLTVSMQ